MSRQGEQLAAVVRAEWPQATKLLDVSCGIGTQAIGLVMQGFSVTASDVSPVAIRRARLESARLAVEIDFSVADMRDAQRHHGTGFDVVISGDNSLPHLLTDADLLTAFREMFACLQPGGGCLVTVRDYAVEQRGRGLLKPYPVRIEGQKRYTPSQIWDFEGDHYDLTFTVLEEDLESGQIITHTMKSRYYAISTGQLCELMRQAGFGFVRRLDAIFYQPVLVGTKAR